MMSAFQTFIPSLIVIGDNTSNVGKERSVTQSGFLIVLCRDGFPETSSGQAVPRQDGHYL